MSEPPISISGTLEELLAECVGNAPEAVMLQDWRGISLRILRLLDERGLVLRGRPKAVDRFTPPGPVHRNETALIACTPNQTAIILERGAEMSALPFGLTKQLWQAMLEDLLKQLGPHAGRGNAHG